MTIRQFFSQLHNTGCLIPDFSQSTNVFEGTQCLILDGKRLASELVEQVKLLSQNKLKHPPKLSVILVGDDPASQVYVKNKIKVFKSAGFKAELFSYTSEEITEEILLQKVSSLNTDVSVHGILVQLPLPPHIKSERILSNITLTKDVDGFSPHNIANLALNTSILSLPCTPFGILLLLKAYKIGVEGKNCVVMGRSRIVGKPMGLLLLNANGTVTNLHSYSQNYAEYTKKADILVVAIGQKHFIQKNDIKPGATVIDVGIHKNQDNSLCGDVHPNVRHIAGALTPVPKGVGPMTIASLLLNTFLCAMNIQKF